MRLPTYDVCCWRHLGHTEAVVAEMNVTRRWLGEQGRYVGAFLLMNVEVDYS